MARVVITFNTDNAAFEDADYGSECARILHGLAGRIESLSAHDVPESFKLYDVNGNHVGQAQILAD